MKLALQAFVNMGMKIQTDKKESKKSALAWPGPAPTPSDCEVFDLLNVVRPEFLGHESCWQGSVSTASLGLLKILLNFSSTPSLLSNGVEEWKLLPPTALASNFLLCGFSLSSP